VIDLGKLDAGQIQYTCSMGIYRGAINAT